MKNTIKSTIKNTSKVLSMKKAEALQKARAVKARNLEISKTISKASSAFSIISFIYSIKDYIKLVFKYFYNTIIIILNSKYFYILKLLIKLWVVTSIFTSQYLWISGYSSFESYDLLFNRLLYFSGYIKESFLSYFYPELLETRKYLQRIKEINSQIDNLNVSDSMKSKLKSNLVSKFNSSSLNWSIINSTDIEELINMSKDQDKHWYDMFKSSYFYYSFTGIFLVTGCYFFPDYTIYPVLNYFGIPVNQTWEEIWRWFLDRGPQPPTAPLPPSDDSIEVIESRMKSTSEIYENIRKNKSRFLDSNSSGSSSSSYDSYVTAMSSVRDSGLSDTGSSTSSTDSNVTVKPTDLSHPLSSILPIFTYFFKGEKVNDRFYNNPVTDFSDTIFEPSLHPCLQDLTEKFVLRKRNYFSENNYEEWNYWLSEYHRTYFFDIEYDEWLHDFYSKDEFTPFKYVEVDNLYHTFKHRKMNYFGYNDDEEWEEWLRKYHKAHYSHMSWYEFLYINNFK